ncbi:MAG: SDR family NAD(P)-dependent oxidoreductase [Frankiales bacterium]|nr:SDR family NAD(P)-dependent oxidoreductase [Frankiales bacterium]
MRVQGAITLVTGAGSGIGAALARRFAAEGAEHVVVADRDAGAAARVAEEVGGTAVTVDVRDPDAVRRMVEATLEQHGRVDLLCSNAGMATGAGLDDPAAWQAAYEVHVMAHVHAAHAVLPSMLARGSGHLLSTASAAGLLTSPGDAPYAVTKHAAVALAEWLAVTYGGRGIGVSVLCPMGVDTPLLAEPLAAGDQYARVVAASGAVIGVDAVADAVMDGLGRDAFLILPHPEVATFWAQKAADPERWLSGMRRLVDAWTAEGT